MPRRARSPSRMRTACNRETEIVEYYEQQEELFNEQRA